MYILPSQPMAYKEQKKQHEELVKLKMIRLYSHERIKLIQIAKSFGCHRNTVRNIVKQFEENVSTRDKERLLNGRLKYEEIVKLMSPVRSQSRRPKTRHPRQANPEQEQYIVKLHSKRGRKVGTARMKRYLSIAFGKGGNNSKKVSLLEKSLATVSEAQIRGVYKRNNLKAAKVRTRNGEVRHLYDYERIAAFEYLHYDTKHILDAGALPDYIYREFDLNKELPLYQWNLIDAKSRFRLMGYSQNLNSEFGLKYLLVALQFVRGTLNNYERRIHVWTDNGTEFFGGSETKKGDWNDRLAVLNADIDSYNPGHDIRKNLIERSHKTDDEDLYIPRGEFMGTYKNFMQEVKQYMITYNSQRDHSGIGMNGRTPLQVLEDEGLYSAKNLLRFPVLHLEKDLAVMSNCTSIVELNCLARRYYEDHPSEKEIPLKTIRNWQVKVPYLKENAQNVLTYYHNALATDFS